MSTKPLTQKHIYFYENALKLTYYSNVVFLKTSAGGPRIPNFKARDGDGGLGRGGGEWKGGASEARMY